jgi:hypothetical protein
MEKIIWAATPEAKAKIAAGYQPPENKTGDCTKIQNARKKAEQVMKEIGKEKLEDTGGALTDST